MNNANESTWTVIPMLCQPIRKRADEPHQMTEPEIAALFAEYGVTTITLLPAMRAAEKEAVELRGHGPDWRHLFHYKEQGGNVGTGIPRVDDVLRAFERERGARFFAEQ